MKDGKKSFIGEILGWFLMTPVFLIIFVVRLMTLVRIGWILLNMKVRGIPFPTKAELKLEKQKQLRSLSQKYGARKSREADPPRKILHSFLEAIRQ